jgi:hypothetical protein
MVRAKFGPLLSWSERNMGLLSVATWGTQQGAVPRALSISFFTMQRESVKDQDMVYTTLQIRARITGGAPAG